MTFRLFPPFLCSGRAEALVTDCISKYYSRLSQEWQKFFQYICAPYFRECCIQPCENKLLSGAIRTAYLGPDPRFIGDNGIFLSISVGLGSFPSYKKVESLYPA